MVAQSPSGREKAVTVEFAQISCQCGGNADCMQATQDALTLTHELLVKVLDVTAPRAPLVIIIAPAR